MLGLLLFRFGDFKALIIWKPKTSVTVKISKLVPGLVIGQTTRVPLPPEKGRNFFDYMVVKVFRCLCRKHDLPTRLSQLNSVGQSEPQFNRTSTTTAEAPTTIRTKPLISE